jgi:hypothetical protein
MFLFIKMSFEYFKKIKKIWKKRPTFISIFYVLAKLFQKQPILVVSCVKKTISGAENSSYWDISLSFLHRTQKMSVFPQKLACTPTMSTCMREIFIDFLIHFKMLFWVAGAYTPKIKSAFPPKLSLIKIWKNQFILCPKTCCI